MSLLDTYGRSHTNLRISVTDRCNLRCTYCMPADVRFLERSHLLTFEEITRFVTAAAGLGVDKVRLTGGEPLLRRDLPLLIRQLRAVPGIRDIGLTTNGILLADQAQALRDAGLERINVSLDTLDPERFREVARRDALDLVLAGIHEAKRVGFAPIKLNAVPMRGVNDCDVAPLAAFARRHGLELHLIEYMPIGGDPWERNKVMPAHELLETLEEAFGPLAPAANYDPHAPAMDFDYVDGGGRVGIIASVTRSFCRTCNRIRLTADGKLRNCLFALDEVDVKESLRRGADLDQLQAVIRSTVHAKWAGHEFNTSRFIKPLRTMHAIGG